MKDHRILVTGGAGFIGSNFVRHMLSSHENIQLVVLDKLTYAGNRENLDELNCDPRFSFIYGDICDFQTVLRAMKECDAVLNFAAETHVDRSLTDPDPFLRTNVEGTFVLLKATRELAVERFIQISTDEVYGNAESPDGTIRPSIETDCLKPLSPYAATKAAADRLAFSYWASFGTPVIITRCSNNYGPYQHLEKQIPLFLMHALAGKPLPVYGSGCNVREWIYVEDHCRALEALLFAPLELVCGEVFNIGSGEERSALDNARAILHLLNQPQSSISHVPDRLGHVRRHAVNAQKLRGLLDWTPRVGFEEGLASTVSWYREHSHWVERILSKDDAFLAYTLGGTR